ncbi:hypothetical protein C8Q80DRAFT_809229 [Daedaleopsis nitida]|nr:hypothetical protein C8Q80DRAFT_809229 [Daedaleopsis nitida]
MVSSVPLAPANPPLSYAERAKKAQNTRTHQIQRSASQSTSVITPATPSSSASRAAPVVSPPPISKASSGPGGSDSRTPTTNPPPPSSSKLPVPHAASLAPEPKQNGDVKHPSDSASSVPSTPKQATASSTNVWTLRKEQMAARALTHSRSSQPSNQATVTTPISPPPPAIQEPLTAPTAGTSTSASGMSLKTSPSMTTSSTNGHPASSAGEEDAFVVKPGRVPSGANMMTPPNGKNEAREDDEKGHEREPSQGHGSRKSEKTKWIPVPPEELQFEGPARNPHVRQRSQNTERMSHRQPGGPSVAASSSSGHGSQQQSRTHSAAGRRTTPSHASSVTHSQTQSRTGSVHSSPRHASIRGGARRLPDEHTGPVLGTTRSIRSSATNSPSTFAQPQPLPAEFMPGMRPYVNISITQGGRDSSALRAIPDSAAAEISTHPVFYPPQPHFGVSPYHSPQPAGSPASSPYPLPPIYPSQPGLPPPMHMSGYGTPPYPIYPPYGYPYGQPYMYWHPPPAISSSPMANPQPIDGVPPPTMLARPPPPSESDAVAGYRDIGFVLPPPAERSRPDHGEERGRRLRELSFGSISADLAEASTSPSPVPKSPGLDVVPEGAALGLDVSGGQPCAQPAQPQEVAAGTCESKSFTVFSIGLSPDEPAPVRIRSRTRTQSRGAATSVSGQTEQPSNDGGDPGSTEDAVAALAESVAMVIDLTDTETKWEFGTTKQDGVVVAVGESAIPPPDPVPPFVESSSAPAGTPGAPFVPIVAPYAVAPPYVPPVTIPTPMNGLASAPSPSPYTSQPPYAVAGDEFEVRDYGFGFGRGGPGPVYPQATVPPRDERPFRERRDYQQQGDREQHYGRPRRGSYGQGGYGYERGGERGSYGGRRGRGFGAGYGGRGYQNRGYAGRGGYSARGQHTYVPQSQPQPESNGYYAPASTLTTYIPQPYDYQYPPYSQPLPAQTPTSSSQSAPAPPTPVPQTAITFPLDSTRYWLLGQLEYYLSAQNLAQDFWLRQQMDSRGWIPISLIASFNRVRRMTGDPQLVTDVLTLSSLVEVRGSYVRMRTWQQYILPTAAPSHVDEDGGPSQDPASAAAGQHPYSHGDHDAASHNHEGEDDEEEDVEFVL